MKTNRFLVLLSVCAVALFGLSGFVNAQTTAAAQSTGPEWHQFKGTNGRTFNGQLTEFGDNLVKGIEENGTPFETTLDQFSAADQAYIRDWGMKKAVKDFSPLIIFDATEKNSTDQATDDTTNRDRAFSSTQKTSTVSKWKSDYKVTVENRAPMTLTDVTVVYNVFRQDSKLNIRSFVGSTDFKTLAPHVTANFTTTQINMEFETTSAEHSSTNVFTGASEGGIRSSTDDEMLIGVWVKAFDSKGTLLTEWCSKPDLQKTQKWKDLPKKETPAAERRNANRGAASGQ